MELPPTEEPLSRDVYLTPESIAIRALVDAIDKRIYQRWKQPIKEEE